MRGSLRGAFSTLSVAGAAGVAIYLLLRRRRTRSPRSPPPLLVLDGGAGLELKRRKAAGLPCAYDLMLFSTAALRETPEAVLAMHRAYIRAGCTVLTTASYAVTRFYLERVGEAERVEELAARSVRLAKAARAAEGAEAERRVLVAASVPPLGESYQAAALPAGEQRAQYAELIRGLKGCDVYARLSPLTSPPLSPRLPLTSPLASSSRRYLCETMAGRGRARGEHVQSSVAGRLLYVIKSGLWQPTSWMGCYASHVDDYSLLAPLFDDVLGSMNTGSPVVANLSMSSNSYDLRSQGLAKSVSIRARLSRNFEGWPLPSRM